MSLIETITLGDEKYYAENYPQLMEDLELVDVFRDKWGIHPAEYIPGSNDRPLEAQLIAETLEAADEDYILTGFEDRGRWCVRVEKPVSTDSMPQTDDTPDTTPSPTVIHATDVASLINQLDVTREELISVLSPTQKEKLVDEYNSTVAQRINGCTEVENLEEATTFSNEIPESSDAGIQFILENVDMPTEILIRDVMEFRQEKYTEIPEAANPRTEFVFVSN